MPRVPAILLVAFVLVGTCALASPKAKFECMEAFQALLTDPESVAAQKARDLAKVLAEPYPYLKALLAEDPFSAGKILLNADSPDGLAKYNAKIAAEGEVKPAAPEKVSVLRFVFDPITKAVRKFLFGDGKPKVSLFVQPRAFTWKETVKLLEEKGLKPQPLSVGKVDSKVRDVPFGKFTFTDEETYDYDRLPASAKKLGSTSNEIYFGRMANSVEDARKIVERYFTRGVERSSKGAHFDVQRHQGNAQSGDFFGKLVSDSANSGFSNGSETYEEAAGFATKTGFGVVFIMDVQGQEILNLSAFHNDVRKKYNAYDWEREVLTKGGRAPKRVRAAVIYEWGKPIAFYTNPNYEPGGGK